jgi:prepilin-type N-terminal cleavage/methylation domain-containing protein
MPPIPALDQPRRRSTRGFTLVEVLFAMLLLACLAAGAAQLIAVASRSGRAARDQTSATVLAAAKLEQLRSLAWAYEPAPDLPPTARSDFTANLSVDPPADSGPGLAESPPGALSYSTPPYVDYLDVQGRWVGTGPDPPASATFIRRWSVRALPQDPSRTLILSAVVTTVFQERARQAPWKVRSGSEALLMTMVTRKGM